MTDSARDVVFVVADKAMQQMLEGFFSRENWQQRLGCGSLAVDARPNRDVFVAEGQHDSGLYLRSGELVRPHLRTHRHAVVMLDADWEGSPGAARIADAVTADVARVWAVDRFAAIVLDPEIEAWFWQPDSPHVAKAMNYRDPKPYREVLERAGHWPTGAPKPPRPKEAREYLLRRPYRTDPSNAVFRRAAANVSVKGCVDPAFQQLCGVLRAWFPQGAR